MATINKYFEPQEIVSWNINPESNECDSVTLKVGDGAFLRLEGKSARKFKVITRKNEHPCASDWVEIYGYAGLLEDCKDLVKW